MEGKREGDRKGEGLEHSRGEDDICGSGKKVRRNRKKEGDGEAESKAKEMERDRETESVCQLSCIPLSRSYYS